MGDEELVKALLLEGPKTKKELKEKLEKMEGKGSVTEHLTVTLQKLKKQGKIKILEDRWVLSGIDVCPCCKGQGWIEKSWEEELKNKEELIEGVAELCHQ
jgi:hypothetical protein